MSRMFCLTLLLATTVLGASKDESDSGRYVNPTVGGRAGNPGLKLRLLPDGLRLANDLSSQFLVKELRNGVVMPHDQVFVLQPDGLEVRLQDLRATDLSFPRDIGSTSGPFDYQLMNASLYSWTAVGGLLTLSGTYRSQSRNPQVISTGNVQVSLDDLQLNTNSVLGRNPDGKLLVNDPTCKTRWNNTFVTISDMTLSDKQLQNIGDKLKNNLETSICGALRKFVSDKLNKRLALAKTKYSVTYDGLLIADFSLLRAPDMYDVGYLETRHKGEISWRGLGATPFYPHDFKWTYSTPSSDDRMANVFVSDFIFNSLLFHAHQQKLFQFVINPQFMQSAQQKLRLNCPNGELCLETVFGSEAMANYSSLDKVQLLFTSAGTPPTVAFRAGIRQSVFDATGSLQVVIKDEVIATVSVSTMRGVFDVLLLDSTMYGSVELQDLKMEAVSPALENDALESLSAVSKSSLEDMINSFFSTGVHLPVIPGVQFDKPTISVYDRALIVETDLSYPEDVSREVY